MTPSNLYVVSPTGTRHLALGAARIVVGSGADAALALLGQGVARSHAELLRNETTGEYWLQDLGTSQGTWVNDERIVSYGPLSERDEVRIGEHRLTFARAVSSQQLERQRAWRQPLPRRPAVLGRELRVDALALTSERRSALASRVHDELIDRLDLRRRDVEAMAEGDLRGEAARLLDGIMTAEWLAEVQDRQQFKQFVLDETLGLGPLDAL